MSEIVDKTKANVVKLTGVLGTEQITATFSKNVLLINAKDTKDNQWKQASFEIYIKPEIANAIGVQDGDKIYVEGWLAFNFWNNRSFPRIVATSVEIIEKAGAQATAPQPQQSGFNQPQQAAPQPQSQPAYQPQQPAAPQAPAGIPTPPPIPGV